MGPLDSNQEFDPTLGVQLQQELLRCSVGKAPTGFRKIRSEMMPADLIKMIPDIRREGAAWSTGGQDDGTMGVGARDGARRRGRTK